MATISIRVNDELKEKSRNLFEALGIDMSTAITMFLAKSVREGGIPFSVSLYDENGLTSSESAELRRRADDMDNGKGVAHKLLGDK